MASFHRLVRLAVAALAAVFVVYSGPSSAAVTYSIGGFTDPTPLGACQKLVASQSRTGAHVRYITSNAAWFCEYSWNGTSGTGDGYISKSGTCDAGTTLDPADGACKVPPSTCPTAGTDVGTSSSEYITTTLTTNVCIGGCRADASGAMYAGGNYRAFGPFRFDNTTCTTNNNPAGDTAPHTPDDNAPGSCPQGTTNIGQDSAGTPICVGKQNDDAPKPPTTTTTTPKVTNPDGSTQQTTTTTSTNSDGSTTTTTTTTTTGADGSTSSSTSSTTSNTPTGAVGHSDSKPDDKGDLCRQHPELNICKNSTVGGACENTTCTGDAIQCEILRQDRQAYCDAIKANDLQGVGSKAISGDTTGLPNISNATSIAVGQVSATAFLGGGSCFQDKTVSFRGQSFTLPLSKACDALIALRYIVMITALLAAYRMLSGTILRT